MNMNEVAGLIFSNLHDRSIPELTGNRTMGAIPFFGGYRMVDFPLSAMAQAGIRNVSIIAHHNFESLVNHVGSGAEWGIPVDKGGVKLISPFMTAYAKNGGERYSSRLETLKSVCDNIERMKEKYIVMCDCDCAFNLDLHEMIDYHVKRNADITVNAESGFRADFDGRIEELDVSPSAAFDLNVNLWVVSRDYLVGTVKNAVSRGLSDMTADVIGRNLTKDKFYVFKPEGEVFRIKSLSDYYRLNMRMLGDSELCGKLLTNIKSRRSQYYPTRIGEKARIVSSVVSEACEINGELENCIVFRGVKVESGAVVKNSILFPGVVISENARLDFVVADKNTGVREGNSLAGCRILPFFIGPRKIF